jgi:hypothetical protein
MISTYKIFVTQGERERYIIIYNQVALSTRQGNDGEITIAQEKSHLHSM